MGPELRDLFTYCPTSGKLTWKISRTNRIKVGQTAGTIQTNHIGKPYERKYLHVRVGRKILLVHRIAVFLMTGEMPKHQVDHRDGNSLNNRWDNLRLATRSQNMMNRNRNRTRRYDLPKGVQFHNRDKLYVARLRDKSLGYFKTPERAKAAYDMAAINQYGEFTRTESFDDWLEDKEGRWIP